MDNYFLISERELCKLGVISPKWSYYEIFQWFGEEEAEQQISNISDSIIKSRGITDETEIEELKDKIHEKCLKMLREEMQNHMTARVWKELETVAEKAMNGGEIFFDGRSNDF